MTWPDHISVFHKLSYLPTASESSFVLDVMILSELHQRPAARCVEDIAVYDYLKKRKATVRPFMLKAFEQTWAEQEVRSLWQCLPFLHGHFSYLTAKKTHANFEQAEKARVEERIREIESTVRSIERATWDRKDAVEDMGGSR